MKAKTLGNLWKPLQTTKSDFQWVTGWMYCLSGKNDYLKYFFYCFLLFKSISHFLSAITCNYNWNNKKWCLVKSPKCINFQTKRLFPVHLFHLGWLLMGCIQDKGIVPFTPVKIGK